VLPLSIAVHAAGALAFFIIPLAAEEPPPAPAPMSSELNIIEAHPVPPPPPPRSTRPMAQKENPNAAPLVAPATIEVEKERPVEPVDPGAAAPGGVVDGVPGGIDLGGPVPPPAAAPPSQLPPARQIFRPGGDIRVPKKIVNVPPIYPAIALNSGVQGVVILEATISETGTIENIRVLRSHPLLERAAVEAVKQWRYTPTRLNGQPVPIIMTVTVNFMIER
jgi:protein TonB